jgi:hypothetical protein
VETSRRDFSRTVDVMPGQMKTLGLPPWKKKSARCCSLDDNRFSQVSTYVCSLKGSLTDIVGYMSNYTSTFCRTVYNL